MDDIRKLTFESIPYAVVLDRVENGEKSSIELLRAFQQRVEQEEKNVQYSAKLSRISMYENEIKQSTIEKSLGYLKNYFLFNWKEQVKSQVDLDTKVIKKFNEERMIRLDELERFKRRVNSGKKECDTMTDNLNKAKKAYEKTKIDLKQAKDRLVMLNAVCLENEINNEKKVEKVSNKGTFGRMISSTKGLWETTPESERIRWGQKVQRREKRLQDCLIDIAIKKRLLAERIDETDNAVQSAINAFQASEVDRQKGLKTTLKEFCSIERYAITKRLEFLDTLEGCIDAIDVDDDVNLFIKQEKRSEYTHKYSKVLSLLDWDYKRRHNDCNSTWVVVDGEKGIDDEEDRYDEELELGRKAMDSTNLDSDDIELDNIKLTDNSTEDGNDNDNDNDTNIFPEIRSAIMKVFDNNNNSSTDSSNDTGNGDTNESIWHRLLNTRKARLFFLQELDDNRGNGQLSATAYDSIVMAMKVCLDYSQSEEDVKSAMRICNMANTFFKVETIDSTNADNNDDSNYNNDNNNNDDSTNKRYVQKDQLLMEHAMWNRKDFWHAAMMEGVASQLDNMDTVIWDELNPDALRETVISVHNLIFGQLGTIIITMRELGLSKDEAQSNILTLCRTLQLAEEQEIELLRSINSLYKVN